MHFVLQLWKGGEGAPRASAMAGTEVPIGMLWACIVLFLPTTLDAPCVAGGGEGGRTWYQHHGWHRGVNRYALGIPCLAKD